MPGLLSKQRNAAFVCSRGASLSLPWVQLSRNRNCRADDVDSRRRVSCGWVVHRSRVLRAVPGYTLALDMTTARLMVVSAPAGAHVINATSSDAAVLTVTKTTVNKRADGCAATNTADAGAGKFISLEVSNLGLWLFLYTAGFLFHVECCIG